MDRSRNFEEGGTSRASKKSKRNSRNDDHLRSVEEELSDEDRFYFRNLLARERYTSLFASKKIVPTKMLVGDFEGLGNLFDERNWMQLFQFNWLTNNNYVREFYANLELVENDDERLSSYIRGVDIYVTPDLISSMLLIPRGPMWDDELMRGQYTDIASILCDRPFYWDGASATLKQGDLSITARIIHFVVGVYVHPVFHTGNVTVERAMAILNIMLGEPLDLPGVIFANMRQFCRHPSGSFGYGFLITALANYFGVYEDNTDIVVAPLTIDSNTVAKSQGQRANVQEMNQEDEEAHFSPPHAPQFGNYTPFPPPPEDLPHSFHRTYDIFSNYGSEVQRGLFEMRQEQEEIRHEQMMSRQSQIAMAESLSRLEDQMRNLRHGGNFNEDNTQGEND